MTTIVYRHGEAFCLMTYRADDGEEEVIWNSRDGVTPFMITLRSGKPARHVEWHRDRRVPDYTPPRGSRIFVDLTDQAARSRARQIAEHWFHDSGHWGNRARAQFHTIDAMIDALVADLPPGSPDIQEVP